ncbi:MAG: hypothetical protein JWN01_11 [Patescibacteria group bacterium]|nr:hypothetical protein [Patescibacteria group bacterium]
MAERSGDPAPKRRKAAKRRPAASSAPETSVDVSGEVQAAEAEPQGAPELSIYRVDETTGATIFDRAFNGEEMHVVDPAYAKDVANQLEELDVDLQGLEGERASADRYKALWDDAVHSGLFVSEQVSGSETRATLRGITPEVEAWREEAARAYEQARTRQAQADHVTREDLAADARQVIHGQGEPEVFKREFNGIEAQVVAPGDSEGMQHALAEYADDLAFLNERGASAERYRALIDDARRQGLVAEGQDGQDRTGATAEVTEWLNRAKELYAQAVSRETQGSGESEPDQEPPSTRDADEESARRAFMVAQLQQAQSMGEADALAEIVAPEEVEMTDEERAAKQAIIDQDYTEALRADPSALAQSEIFQKYKTYIENTNDEPLKVLLAEKRDKAIKYERERQKVLADERSEEIAAELNADPAVADQAAREERARHVELQRESDKQIHDDLSRNSQDSDHDDRRGWRSWRTYRDDAHAEALTMDPSARAQSEVWQRYEDQIRRPGIDAETIKRLREEQALETDIEQVMQKEVTRQRARNIAMEAKELGQVLKNAEDHKASRNTITVEDDNVEGWAAGRRKQLGLEPEPFFEENKGGLLQLGLRDNGPRTVLSYFGVPDNRHVMVVEDRRRDGTLLSQTVITTREGIRDVRGGRKVPPKEARDVAKEIWQQDKQGTVDRGDVKFRDWAGVGLGVAGKAIDGPDGVYARYAHQVGKDYNTAAYRRKSRRGSIVSRITGGRI